MDFYDAKENIQPLPAGRNANILQASLLESREELMNTRKRLEQAIHSYSGDDPLEPWYAYISWIEQSYPSGGKESGGAEVLVKCLSHFESVEQYYQDQRMIKLYISFIDSHKNPTEYYQRLFNAGIGTMVADFYIAWAYYYELSGNSRKADEIFKRGLACRAQPLEELQDAHVHFNFTVAQNMLLENDDNAKKELNRQLHERRFALTSLRGNRRKAATGTIRTGAAVKSFTPGTVQIELPSSSSSSRSNAPVRIFSDENKSPNIDIATSNPHGQVVVSDATVDSGSSVIRSIIDAARNQENEREPGPWNKAHDKKSGKLFDRISKAKEVGFSIHEDECKDSNVAPPPPSLQPAIVDNENNLAKPFKYPANFQRNAKRQVDWQTPVTIENKPERGSLPQYNKCMLYPRPNMEFQPEEWLAYKRLKRANIANGFTRERDIVWSSYDVTANVRQYPNFAKRSEPQTLDALDTYFEPPKNGAALFAFNCLYNGEAQEEFQFEELMACHYLNAARNETILKAVDMDETVLVPSDAMPRRKSFFPKRRSVAINRTAFAAASPDAGLATSIANATTVAPPTFDLARATRSEAMCDDGEHIPAAVSQIVSAGSPEKEPEPRCTFPSFAIFEDPTTTTTTTPSDAADDFQFKKPTAIRGGAYDADETCSTQTFSIFLKAQSASTPKFAPLKTASRIFGTVLPPAPLIQPYDDDDDQFGARHTADPAVATAPGAELSYETVATASCTTRSLSPLLLKQLSTILETSEHGSSQGTHTSGGANKSSSSPEFMTQKNESFGTGDTPPLRAELSTVAESSSPVAQAQAMLANVQLQTAGDMEMSHAERAIAPAASMLCDTPGPMRLANELALFDATTGAEPALKGAGNFTRLDEEREDTGAFLVRPMRFDEDRTETMSKSLQASQFVKFQDDKTETISKLLLAAPTTLPKVAEMDDVPYMPVEALSDPVNLDSFAMFADSPPRSNVHATSILANATPSPLHLLTRQTAAHDSFIPEFSFIAETQATAPATTGCATSAQRPQLIQSTNKALSADDSFGLDFSVIMPTQPLASLSDQAAKPLPPAAVIYKGTGGDRAEPLASWRNESAANCSVSNCSSSKQAKAAPHAQQPTAAQSLPPNTSVSYSNNAEKNTAAAEKNSKSTTFPGVFELNAETDMFAPNLSIIKNSTWLPSQHTSHLAEASLHIKQEAAADDSLENPFDWTQPIGTAATAAGDASKSTASVLRASAWVPAPPAVESMLVSSFGGGAAAASALGKDEAIIELADSDEHELSSNFKDQPKTPLQRRGPLWMTDGGRSEEILSLTLSPPQRNQFLHSSVDLNESNQQIEQLCMDHNVNPFQIDLQNAFLDQIDFLHYIDKLATCKLQGHVGLLHPATRVRVHNAEFHVLKLIAEGGYGAIYSAKETNTDALYALKQERPPNYWEYYICLEVQNRIAVDELLSAYMSVDFALIGNNASVLIAPLSPHGSLITVCNKIRQVTMKKLEEQVVMVLTCELLDIVDHLHAVGIIHADLKADNFLLMRDLRYPSEERSLQLIDFGVAIDMKLFKPGQKFNYVNSQKAFKCVEMREERPWTYQLDLYGLASIVHVLLFGKYMEIERLLPTGKWMHKEHIPRYFDKQLWENIFQTLLNVRDCNTLPDLQKLRATLKEALADNEKFAKQKLADFNKALHN